MNNTQKNDINKMSQLNFFDDDFGSSNDNQLIQKNQSSTAQPKTTLTSKLTDQDVVDMRRQRIGRS